MSCLHGFLPQLCRKSVSNAACRGNKSGLLNRTPLTFTQSSAVFMFVWSESAQFGRQSFCFRFFFSQQTFSLKMHSSPLSIITICRAPKAGFSVWLGNLSGLSTTLLDKYRAKIVTQESQKYAVLFWVFGGDTSFFLTHADLGLLFSLAAASKTFNIYVACHGKATCALPDMSYCNNAKLIIPGINFPVTTRRDFTAVFSICFT